MGNSRRLSPALRIRPGNASVPVPSLRVYDGFGRLSSSTLKMDGVSQAVASLYREDGVRTRITHPGGAPFTYTYDPAGHLTGVYAGTDTSIVLATFTWNAQGLRATRAERYGSSVAWGYDLLGRLTSQSDLLAGDGEAPEPGRRCARLMGPAGAMAVADSFARIDKRPAPPFDAATTHGKRGLDVAASFKSVIVFPAAGLMLAALAACGGDGGGKAGNGAAASGNAANALREAEAAVAAASVLFPDNFKGVCSGASVSAAAAYDPNAASHKALYFATYRDDFMDQSSSLPRDWTIQWSQNGDALRGIDLVVCARRTAAREVKLCDGYQNHGAPTQNRVRWHTATYELSVREAKTGRQLGQNATVEATNDQCPSFMTFQSDAETVDGYASLPDSAVADFLRPHITH